MVFVMRQSNLGWWREPEYQGKPSAIGEYTEKLYLTKSAKMGFIPRHSETAEMGVKIKNCHILLGALDH